MALPRRAKPRLSIHTSLGIAEDREEWISVCLAIHAMEGPLILFAFAYSFRERL